MSSDRIQSLIQAIRENNPYLKELDFRDIDGSRAYQFERDSAVLKDLLNALRTNTTVQHVIVVLRCFRNLLWEEKQDIFRLIGSLPKLEQLRVASGGTSDLALQLLAETLPQASSLKSLTIQTVYFGRVMSQQRAVASTVNLGVPPQKCLESFFNAFSKLGQLESLVLEDVEQSFDLNNILKIAISLPNLTHLSVEARDYPNGGPDITRQVVHSIFQTCTLKSLALRRLNIGDFLPELLVDLEENNVLEKLVLEQTMMRAQCGMALAYLLRTNDSLHELHVGHNMIPDNTGAAILNALTSNTSLRVLDFTANELGSETSEAVGRLLSSDPFSSALVYLNLSQNNLRDRNLSRIVSTLKTNTTLKSLTLAENMATPSTFRLIGASLAFNSTLERLNLANNKGGDEGCDCIARALKDNNTLKALNLFGNRVTTRGAVAMAEVLQRNSTLEQLNLASNGGIDIAGYKALEKTIQGNYCLQHLWLPALEDVEDLSIYSFLRLNRLNRKRLIDEMDNAQLWADTLQACADDICCVHYLVRTNPAVVSWLP